MEKKTDKLSIFLYSIAGQFQYEYIDVGNSLNILRHPGAMATNVEGNFRFLGQNALIFEQK